MSDGLRFPKRSRKKKTKKRLIWVLPPKSKMDKERHAEIAKMSCLACGSRPVEVAHLNTKMGQPKDHQQTAPLCFGCHRGDKLSHHRAGRKFAAKYGTDDELIKRTNNLLYATGKEHLVRT